MTATSARHAQAIDTVVAEAALSGLLASRKTLPPKLFYDDEGCRLFGQITRLPENYPTRTELALLGRVATEAVAGLPEGSALVKYSGSDETKALRLFDPAASCGWDFARVWTDAGQLFSLHLLTARRSEP